MTDTPTAPNERDHEVAVNAVVNVVQDGFVVGCCVMSDVDGHELSALIVDDIATYRAEIEAAARADERAKRDAHYTAHLESEAMVERVARIIAPSCWAVMDGYLADTKRKYKGQNVGWPTAQFQDSKSMAIARAVIAAQIADMKGTGA